MNAPGATRQLIATPPVTTPAPAGPTTEVGVRLPLATQRPLDRRGLEQARLADKVRAGAGAPMPPERRRVLREILLARRRRIPIGTNPPADPVRRLFGLF